VTGAASVIPRAADECVLRTTACSARFAPRAGTWVLAATILGSSMASIDGTVVNVALPRMQGDLRATAADLLWVIEAYSLFLSALILVGGSLGDRLGRRKVFAAGIALFTAASIACGLSPNVAVLVAARAIQGIGGALLVPGSLAIISAAFDESSRGKAIGTWSGFSALTIAIGPVLGGWLVQNASWRWVFLINVPLAAVTVWLLYAHVPESRDEEASGPLDWLGALLVTAGLGGVTFGLIEAGPRGFSDRMVSSSLAGGVILLALFVAVERLAPAPMMPLDVFHSRTFTGANLLTLLLYGALGGGLYFFPFDLQQVQGYSPTAAGAALLPFVAIVFLLSRWAGGLVTRYGARPPLIVGPIVTAGGFVLFTLPGIGGSYWTTFFPAVVVMSLGMCAVISPLTTTVMNAVPGHRSGIASGVNNAVSRAAALVAIAVLGLAVVQIFDSSLNSKLDQLRVTAGVRSAVIAQRARLAGAEPPGTLPASERARLHRATEEAFVDGFRAAMAIAACLAVASAMFAAWLIPGKTATATSTRAARRSAGEPATASAEA